MKTIYFHVPFDSIISTVVWFPWSRAIDIRHHTHHIALDRHMHPQQTPFRAYIASVLHFSAIKSLMWADVVEWSSSPKKLGMQNGRKELVL